MATYVLDAQVGFLLRRASQRHTAIFAERMGPDLTPTQFAALVRLGEDAPLSQNELGRRTAMDVATIKGVIGRLALRGLVTSVPDPQDRRRVILDLTDHGRATLKTAMPVATAITAETLKPLAADEQAALITLLEKLG